MKYSKLIITLFVSMISVSAFAQPASVRTEVETFNPKIGNSSTALSIAPGLQVANLFVDAKLTNVSKDNSRNVNTIELRAKYTKNLVGKLDGFGRVGAGTTLSKGSVNFYSAEAGVSYAINSKLSTNASYRLIDSPQNGTNIRTTTAFAGLDYDLTPTDTIGVKLFKSYDTSKGKGVQLAYTRQL